MSRRALFSLLLLVGSPLAAQSPEAVLRHRLVYLTARRDALKAQVATRDSLMRYQNELVPIGRAPLTLLVPVWAAEKSAPLVDSVIQTWESRVGPLFMRAPAETIAVPFTADTVGLTRTQVDWTLYSHPGVILFTASRASAGRVSHEVGTELVHWLGEQFPPSRPGVARREAILALARDTLGVGPACLEGTATACLTMLRREGPDGDQVRRAFADWAISTVGVEGWARLAGDTTGSPEARVVALVGSDPATAAGRWIAAVRLRSDSVTTESVGFHLLALAWTAGLVLLFLWRLTWHRV